MRRCLGSEQSAASLRALDALPPARRTAGRERAHSGAITRSPGQRPPPIPVRAPPLPQPVPFPSKGSNARGCEVGLRCRE